MKIYDIYDQEMELSVGTLLYYEIEKNFIVELQDRVDEWSAPLLFSGLVKKNIYTIPKEISFLWVKERVIPSGRQNLSAILSTHKLSEYDEMKFLEISQGICSQDSLCIKRMDSLPDYIIGRQKKNIREVVLLDGWRLLCFFNNGKVKAVDFSKLIDVEGVDKIISNEKLFQSGKIGTGGYAVTFNDSIDVPAKVLYERGTGIPLSLEDFKAFVVKNVIDTSDSCNILECSRQNVAYMLKQEQITAVKEDVKGNLYLKGDILRNRW